MLFSLLLSSCNDSTSDISSSKDEDCAIAYDYLYNSRLGFVLATNHEAYKPFKKVFYLNTNESKGKTEYVLELTKNTNYNLDLVIYRYFNRVKRIIYKIENATSYVGAFPEGVYTACISNFAFEVLEDTIIIYAITDEVFKVDPKMGNRLGFDYQKVYAKIFLQRKDGDFSFKITKQYFIKDPKRKQGKSDAKHGLRKFSNCFKYEVLNKVLLGINVNHYLDNIYEY